MHFLIYLPFCWIFQELSNNTMVRISIPEIATSELGRIPKLWVAFVWLGEGLRCRFRHGITKEPKKGMVFLIFVPNQRKLREELLEFRGLYLELKAGPTRGTVEIPTSDEANPSKPELMGDFLLFQQWKGACRGWKPSCPRRQLCRCWWSGTTPTTPQEGPATTRSGIYLSPVSWTWWVTTLRGSAGHGMWANSFFTCLFYSVYHKIRLRSAYY